MTKSHSKEETAKRAQLEQADQEEQERRNVVSPNAGLNPVVTIEEPAVADDMILAYKKLFGNQNGYKEPDVRSDGSIEFSFPNKGDAENFFLEQAGLGHHFIIIDQATNSVMGYSDGKGGLYHADETPFEKGDKLKPSTISKDQFQLPETIGHRM